MSNRQAAQLTVLDCTFRDGGYYNNWDFKPKLVQGYLEAVSAANIDIVEVAFRARPTGQFYGPFAFGTDEFLRRLPFPKDVAMCVMVDAKDLIRAEQQQASALRRQFASKSESPVSVVRVAAHFSEVAQSAPFLQELKALGYVVGLNLMQSTQQPDEAIVAAAKQVQSWGVVDVLYFADSLGDMVPAGVRKMVQLLRAGWTGAIGLHAHDNKAIALLNTLEAIDQGVTWVDSTMLGMGRGAGNTKTEHLLIELASRGYTKYNPKALFELVLNDFSELQKEYNWGSSLLYYLAAEYAIHPTYVQKMLGMNHVSAATVIGGIERLRSLPSLSYNARHLEDAMGGDGLTETGTCDASSVVNGRDVLLLAGGDSVREHQDGLAAFIASRKDLFVINLNAEPYVDGAQISAFASCYPMRIVTEFERLIALKKPLITPVGAIPENWRGRMQQNQVLDYGLRVAPATFAFGKQGATLPTALVALYAIAFANAGGAKRIYLAGFDGFPPGDERQLEMVRLLEKYTELPAAAPLVAVTPTTYPVQQSSIYDPKA